MNRTADVKRDKTYGEIVPILQRDFWDLRFHLVISPFRLFSHLVSFHPVWLYTRIMVIFITVTDYLFFDSDWGAKLQIKLLCIDFIFNSFNYNRILCFIYVLAQPISVTNASCFYSWLSLTILTILCTKVILFPK